MPLLIGLAGPSCSGKTEISRWLSRHLDAQLLSIDSYYRDLSHLSPEERRRVNYDEPASIDEQLLTEQLELLCHGRAIEKPVYDFTIHNRARNRETFSPTPYVLIEGLFTLHWEATRNLLAAAVFVDAPHEVCLARRIERDIRERGRTEASVREQYERTVRPMCDRWVMPTQRFANLTLSGLEPIEENGGRILDHVSRLAPRVSAAVAG